MDALAARLSQLAEVSAPSRVGPAEEEVVSPGEAAEDTGAEVTDAEVGVFGWRPTAGALERRVRRRLRSGGEALRLEPMTFT